MLFLPQILVSLETRGSGYGTDVVVDNEFRSMHCRRRYSMMSKYTRSKLFLTARHGDTKTDIVYARSCD